MNEQQAFFVDRLLAWYDVHKRDLPWRRSKDPYRIWVSEIMLQQTRVETVIPYYNRFMERFPTSEALAEAPEDEVLKMWEGLGYYSRVRNLQAAVREVQTVYGGRVPDTLEEISSLKGVGPYTAGAVLSIAYDKREPAVDGNVLRVLSRYFLLRDDIAKPSTRTGMERMLRGMIPERAGDFNQAIMELGATVCTPKSPHCLTCPVMEQCEGRLAGEEESLPIKTKAKAPRPERRVAVILRASDGRVLVRRRPANGLLAGMWEFPHALVDAGESPDRALAALVDMLHGQGIGPRFEPNGPLGAMEHTFSHIQWNLDVYAAYLNDVPKDDADSEYRWIVPAERDAYSWPNVFDRMWKQWVS